MNSKAKLALGTLTAMAMFLLAFALPRGSGTRDAVLVLVSNNCWSVDDLCFAIREIEIGSTVQVDGVQGR
jgi:hypothetical protein